MVLSVGLIAPLLIKCSGLAAPAPLGLVLQATKSTENVRRGGSADCLQTKENVVEIAVHLKYTTGTNRDGRQTYAGIDKSVHASSIA